MPRQMGGAKPYSSDAWDAGRAVEEMCSRRTRRARRRVVGAMRVGWRVIVLLTIAGAAGTIKSMGDGFDDENVKGSASKPRGGGLVPGGAVVPPRMCRHERVYPRGCGVTCIRGVSRVYPVGLSPRVRGHPLLSFIVPKRLRSIPAGAGSPSPETCCGSARRVYPRGCGVTCPLPRRPLLGRGLSPRVRGHPCYSLSGPGRYGPVAPCIAPKTRQSVAGRVAVHQPEDTSFQLQPVQLGRVPVCLPEHSGLS